MVGDNRYNDRIEITVSPQYMADSLALEREYQKKLAEIDPAALTGQARLTYDIFKLDRELAIEGFRFPAELIPINQSFSMPSLFAQLGAGGNLHPFATVKDYEDWLKRTNDFVTWVDQAIVNILKQNGVQIARRTVAKYRDQLGVLSARMRKRV